jgi:hypothetical protein
MADWGAGNIRYVIMHTDFQQKVVVVGGKPPFLPLL